MKKQDLIKAIEIHMELEDFNSCEIGVTLAVLDTVIDLKSIGGNKNG